MRILFIFFITIPFFGQTQINRSATELAQERIHEYIVTKIFKDMLYKPVSYGSIKAQQDPQSRISWSIGHQFEIIDSQFVADKKTAVKKPYYFSFYLDKKLKVVIAQSYHVE
jgi:hypothetical protein